MEVIDYLNTNIQYFNVDHLELVFDVRNTGELLDARQTYEFLQSIEENVPIAPMLRKLKVQIFVDLTESSDDMEGRLSAHIPFDADPKDIVDTGRKRKQRVKRSPGQSSAKKRTKAEKSKVTKTTATTNPCANEIKVNLIHT